MLNEDILTVSISSDDAVISDERVNILLMQFEYAVGKIVGSHLYPEQTLGDICLPDQAIVTIP